MKHFYHPGNIPPLGQSEAACRASKSSEEIVRNLSRFFRIFVVRIFDHHLVVSKNDYFIRFFDSNFIYNAALNKFKKKLTESLIWCILKIYKRIFTKKY